MRKYVEKLFNKELGKAFCLGEIKVLLEEGYSYKEISKRLNKPELTIRHCAKLLNEQ